MTDSRVPFRALQRVPAAPRWLVLAGSAAVLLSACASAATPAPTAAPTVAPSAAGVAGLTINAATSSLGTFLTGKDGMTLYVFTRDTTPGSSACTTDQCVGTWPAATVDAGQQATAGSGVTGTLATFQRADGATQVSYDGHPLYYYAGDTTAGDTNGEGVGGIWFVADVSGSMPTAAPATAAPSQGTGSTTYTIATATGAAGTYLTGEDGRTLYEYAKDTTPGTSACTSDQCATNWPALTLETGEQAVAGSGVPGTIATFMRPDGSTQVSYDGHPLYYFSGDSSAGDTYGDGVGGVWSVARPEASGSTAPSPGYGY
jgi:predicted lipoprotein with Yx(FWY)xxD motif